MPGKELRKRYSVFVSYAHRDGMDFTRRLVFALSMYTDVFWDRRLRAEPFPEQLCHEIKERDFFLFVMTPASSESQWCAKELDIAEDKHKTIIPIKIFPDCIAKRLWDKQLTIPDFSEDFEPGFRQLTNLVIGRPISSWEQIQYERKDEAVLRCLEQGLIPGLFAREVIEWVVVERVWPYLGHYIQKTDAGSVLKGTPRTAMGVLRQCHSLKEQFGTFNDAIGVQLTARAEEISRIAVDTLVKLGESDQRGLGNRVSQVLSLTREYFALAAHVDKDVRRLIEMKVYFDFDVAERLRELVRIHANRSRYLY